MLTLEQVNNLEVATRVSGILSICGTVAVVTYMLWAKKLNNTVYRLIFFLSFADFLLSLNSVPSRKILRVSNGRSTLCQAQGFLLYIGIMCSFFWTTMLALNLLLTIVYRKTPKELRSYEKYYHAICWCTPLVMGSILLIPAVESDGLPVYGNADLWCFISNDYKQLRLFVFYLPLWLIFGFILTCYVIVGVTIYKATKNLAAGPGPQQELAKINGKYIRKVSLFLLIFVVSWISATVTRLMEAKESNIPYSLFIANAILLPLTGFMNAVVYFGVTAMKRCNPSGKYSTTSDILPSTSAGASHHKSKKKSLASQYIKGEPGHHSLSLERYETRSPSSISSLESLDSSSSGRTVSFEVLVPERHVRM